MPVDAGTPRSHHFSSFYGLTHAFNVGEVQHPLYFDDSTHLVRIPAADDWARYDLSVSSGANKAARTAI